MKVYELMNELSKLPAGAEVEFNALMTIREFAELPIVDTDNGHDLYALRKVVGEVEIISKDLAVLRE